MLHVLYMYIYCRGSINTLHLLCVYFNILDEYTYISAHLYSVCSNSAGYICIWYCVIMHWFINILIWCSHDYEYQYTNKAFCTKVIIDVLMQWKCIDILIHLCIAYQCIDISMYLRGIFICDKCMDLAWSNETVTYIFCSMQYIMDVP